MRADTLAALMRLAKGKNALSAEKLIALCADIKGARVEDIRAALAGKLARRAPARAAAPEWLAEMTRAQKRIRWTAREAVDTLYEIAVREGLCSARDAAARPASLSFTKAAARIVGGGSGEALARAFVAWVDEHVRANARG